jgi:hypothetical protein
MSSFEQQLELEQLVLVLERCMLHGLERVQLELIRNLIRLLAIRFLVIQLLVIPLLCFHIQQLL